MSLNEELLDAIKYNHIKSVKECIRNGADVNYKDNEPLKMAIKNDSHKILELLIKNGADVNGSTHSFSHLHIAIINKNYTAVKMLVEGGADINLEHKYGTPLEWVVRNYSPDAKMVRLLLELGANPFLLIKNYRGQINVPIIDVIKETLPEIYDEIMKEKFLLASDQLWNLTQGNIEAETQRDLADMMGVRKGGQRKTKRRKSVKRRKTRSQRKH